MLLRRELSRLASQILTVARTQGMAQVQPPRMVVEVTQAYIEPSAINEPASAASRARATGAVAGGACRKWRRA